jgi:hypothetical protein
MLQSETGAALAKVAAFEREAELSQQAEAQARALAEQAEAKAQAQAQQAFQATKEACDALSAQKQKAVLADMRIMEAEAEVERAVNTSSIVEEQYRSQFAEMQAQLEAIQAQHRAELHAFAESQAHNLSEAQAFAARTKAHAQLEIDEASARHEALARQELAAASARTEQQAKAHE